MEIKLDQTFRYQDTVSIKWTRFGKDSGPSLIFLHGTPWSSQLWGPIARCFAAEYSVYIYDLPGYGQSIHPLDTDFQPTYPTQTKVFCALLEHWRSMSDSDFKPHVVTHDIGGHIALRALLIEGATFSSLCAVDCGASHPVDEPFFALVRDHGGVLASLPSKLHEAMLREYIRGASYQGLRKTQEDMLVHPWLTEEGQKGYYAQIQAQKNEDIEDFRKSYRKLPIPFHNVWAKNDTWVPVERAYKLQEAVGGSLRIIESAGHLIQMDAPEALTAELMKWLQKVQAGQANMT